jgi:hypothetical protein
MKNRLLKLSLSIVVAALFLTNCEAQKQGRIKGDGNVINETREVGSFDKMGVSGSFDINLVKGKEGKIEIKIEKNLLPYLITEVENGKLKIRWKKGTSINTNRGVHLTVHFKDINGISSSGSSDIKSIDLIKTDNLEVAVSGSGDITLQVDVNELNTRVSGSGDLDFKGAADNFTAAMSGSGDIEAFALQTNTANLKISGSADIKISVKDNLYARVSGSGGVTYKGNPKIEDIKVSGSGNISSY